MIRTLNCLEKDYFEIMREFCCGGGGFGKYIKTRCSFVVVYRGHRFINLVSIIWEPLGIVEDLKKKFKSIIFLFSIFQHDQLSR
jgi:hypothetical protein